jgi:hypothetical protein
VAAPCWQILLSDSYDGRVDHRYSPSCFHQAVAHIPTVVDVYTGTREELLRALQLQLSGKGPVAPIAAGAAGAGGVPVPLLVLGAVALLLVGAGLAGTLWRRLRTGSGS